MWIPHPVDSSAISLLRLFDTKMGPLNDSLVHLGFRRPELFPVLLVNRGIKPQASVVSVTRAFEFSPLTGSVNPAGRPALHRRPRPFALHWGPLGRAARRLADGPGRAAALRRRTFAGAGDRPENYSLASWQYQRTDKYGSPQVKADGTPRQGLARGKRRVFNASISKTWDRTSERGHLHQNKSPWAVPDGRLLTE